MEEYNKVASALRLTECNLGSRFRGRWLLVLHSTARAEVDLAAMLPVNCVLIDATCIEAHMGPVLSSALRLTIRGRKANANWSSYDELLLVDGVGETTAEAIITARNAGAFNHWADLCERVPQMRIKKISEDDFEF